jgi:serine protease Do
MRRLFKIKEMETRRNVLKRNRYTWWIALLLLPALALASCSSATAALTGTDTPEPVATTVPPTAAPAILPDIVASDALNALEDALGSIYARVNPSVVNIRVVQQVDATSMVVPEIPEIPGFPLPQLPESESPPLQQGAGSGFVWDKEGHIVTNNHVVEGADKIEVTFADGAIAQAELVGADPDSDLAVIKVDVPTEQLQPVEVADSTQVNVGQLAVAIGNPFALEGTMTVGFVSAVGRSLPVSEVLSQGPGYVIPDIIQTDAPINPGNSGGVLVDDEGRLIGVTAAIESPVRANAGIGFAIPSVIVQKVVPALIDTGQYDHSLLGLSGATLTPDLAEAMGLDSDQRGVLVAEVTSGGPADKAGLHGSDRDAEIEGQQMRVGGDVIVAIDGQPVKEFDDIVIYLARSTEVGQTVTLTVLRQGEEMQVQATLEARPRSEAESTPVEGSPQGSAWLGIAGLTVTPEIAENMALDSDQQGVLVEEVVQDSPADKAKLRGSDKSVTIDGQQVTIGGDVITALDGNAVERFEDLQALVRQAKPDQEVTLTVLRDGQEIEVPVTLGERPAPIP